MELLHLRAGAMRAVVTGWLRRPLHVRIFKDILVCFGINMIELICVNGRKSRMFFSLNVNLGVSAEERLASGINLPWPTELTRGK
jgi:hypothetical protein